MDYFEIDAIKKIIVISYFEINALIKLIVVIVFVLITGYLLVNNLLLKNFKMNTLEELTLTILLGLFVTSFITFLISISPITLTWSSLFFSLLSLDIIFVIILFSSDPTVFTFHKMRKKLTDYKKIIISNKQQVRFLLLVYIIIFSLIWIPYIRGNRLGVRGDSKRYMFYAQSVTNGISPLSNELITFDNGASLPISSCIYTLFYIMTLTMLSVLAGYPENVYLVSSIIAPSISALPLPAATYMLVGSLGKKGKERKLGLFLTLFISEEMLFWSFYGKGQILAFAFIFTSLHFVFKAIKNKENLEQRYALLSGVLMGIACLYHISSLIVVLMILVFVIIGMLIRERKERLKFLLFSSIIGILLPLVFWIPVISTFYQTAVTVSMIPTGGSKANYPFYETAVYLRFLYPFLIASEILLVIRSKEYLSSSYLVYFFGVGTSLLFILGLLFHLRSVYTKRIGLYEKLLLVCFIVAYLYPLQTLVLPGVYFIPYRRFVVFLDIIASLSLIRGLNNELIEKWFFKWPTYVLLLIFTFRWFLFAFLILPVYPHDLFVEIVRFWGANSGQVYNFLCDSVTNIYKKMISLNRIISANCYLCMDSQY